MLFQSLRLFYKVMVNGCRTRAKAVIAKLIRRVSDDDVELHFFPKDFRDAGFDIVGVKEGVGVGF